MKKRNMHTGLGATSTQLRKLIKSKDVATRGLAKLALACWECRGVRLSMEEVDGIIRMDDALHQRVMNDLEQEPTK